MKSSQLNVHRPGQRYRLESLWQEADSFTSLDSKVCQEEAPDLEVFLLCRENCTMLSKQQMTATLAVPHRSCVKTGLSTVFFIFGPRLDLSKHRWTRYLRTSCCRRTTCINIFPSNLSLKWQADLIKMRQTCKHNG